MASTPAIETSTDTANRPTPEVLERARQMLQAGTPISGQAPSGDLNAYSFAIREQAARLARERADLEAKARLAGSASR